MEAPSRRPMTFTFLELLDRTFRLYRENFVTIVGLVAIVTIPITIITLLLNPATSYALGNQSSSLSRTQVIVERNSSPAYLALSNPYSSMPPLLILLLNTVQS